jgi:hypothetical protein
MSLRTVTVRLKDFDRVRSLYTIPRLFYSFFFVLYFILSLSAVGWKLERFFLLLPHLISRCAPVDDGRTLYKYSDYDRRLPSRLPAQAQARWSQPRRCQTVVRSPTRHPLSPPPTTVPAGAEVTAVQTKERLSGWGVSVGTFLASRVGGFRPAEKRSRRVRL